MANGPGSRIDPTQASSFSATAWPPAACWRSCLRARPIVYDVTIFGAEPRVNYDRIMLSPVLAGEKQFDDIVVHDDAWYAQHHVDLRKGETVVAIDRAAQDRAHRSPARSSAMTTLIIATGSRPILIPVPGAELARRRHLPRSRRCRRDARRRREGRQRGGDRRRPARPRSRGRARAEGHEDDRRPSDADPDGAPARSQCGLSAAEGDREARHRGPDRRQHQRHPRRRQGRGACGSRTAAPCRPISSSWRSASAPTSRSPRTPGSRSSAASWSTIICAPATTNIFAVGECVEHRGAMLRPGCAALRHGEDARRRRSPARQCRAMRARRSRPSSRSPASICSPPAISPKATRTTRSCCAIPRAASTSASCCATTASSARCSMAIPPTAPGISTC